MGNDKQNTTMINFELIFDSKTGEYRCYQDKDFPRDFYIEIDNKTNKIIAIGLHNVG